MHVQTVKNRSFSPPSLWPGMGLSTAIYIISDTSASYKCLECVMYKPDHSYYLCESTLYNFLQRTRWAVCFASTA